MEQSQIESYKSLFMNILNAEFCMESDLVTEVGGDEIDTFNQTKEQEMGLRLKSRNSVYLKKVKHALDRIYDGSFGICEDCGAEIGETRLAARPTATMCIHCKEEEERASKQTVHGNRHSVKFHARIIPMHGEGYIGTKEDRSGLIGFKQGEPELDPTAD